MNFFKKYLADKVPIDADKKDKRARRILKRLGIALIVFSFIVFIGNIVFVVAGINAGYFHRWSENQYFGKIVSLRSDGLTIANQEGTNTEVLVTPATKIFQGRHLVPHEILRINTYVIVVGFANSQSQIEASVIRVFGGNK